MTALDALLRAHIAENGPMPLDVWMAACLMHPDHGYYATRDPFGAAADFVTAPEISQMFGELIGAWTAQVWADQGRPDPFALVEFGPGRGTLMRDALRVASGLPGFRQAARIWLVEASSVLRARQAAALDGQGVRWAAQVEELPDLPTIALANEFFDALPVRQAQRLDSLWCERRVVAGEGGMALTWGPPRADAALDRRFPDVRDGAVVEVCPAGEALAARLGDRIAARGGATLVIDYGAWDGIGDTLQAVRRHVPVAPLEMPGEVDLTTHVRFRALAEAARPARHHGPDGQGAFLERLGITTRARILARGRSDDEVDAIAAAHRRLTHPDEMGTLFQVMALVPPEAPVPPGFGA